MNPQPWVPPAHPLLRVRGRAWVRNIQANKITVSFLPRFVMAQAWWDKASQVIEIGSALVALQAEPFPCQDLGDSAWILGDSAWILGITTR